MSSRTTVILTLVMIVAGVLLSLAVYPAPSGTGRLALERRRSGRRHHAAFLGRRHHADHHAW